MSVDILLPYWGEFRLLRETIESVLAQTHSDWRLWIVDDHYPSDEAEKFVESLGDPRITYIRHDENIGITRNFNFCIEKATAKYCVLLGCDDRLLPNYLETALGVIGDADFYQPAVDIINADGQPHLPLVDRVKRILRPRKAGLYRGDKLATSLARGNWLYFPSILWKTSTLQRYRFDEKYRIVQDVVLEFSMILDDSTLYLDSEKTFQYRRFADSLSSREKGKEGIRFGEENTVYDEFAQKFKQKGWTSAARTAKFRIISRIHQFIS